MFSTAEPQARRQLITVLRQHLSYVNYMKISRLLVSLDTDCLSACGEFRNPNCKLIAVPASIQGDTLRIAVVGSGYVGLVATACFAELGHQVISVDNDQQKIAMLNRGDVPIHEEFLGELLDRHRGKLLTFSTDLPQAVRDSQAIFIAVGTPSTEFGDADLSYVEQVSREVASAIDDYKIVVEKSTVPVFTSNWVRRVLMLDGADAENFDVASNPESYVKEPPSEISYIPTASSLERTPTVARLSFGRFTNHSLPVPTTNVRRSFPTPPVPRYRHPSSLPAPRVPS